MQGCQKFRGVVIGPPQGVASGSESASGFGLNPMTCVRNSTKRKLICQGTRYVEPLARLFITQLAAAKVSRPDFGPNQRKFRRHFKGVFWNGNMEVRILPGQPASPTTGDFALSKLRNARQWRAFANRLAVSGLQNRPLSERNRR